MKSILTVDVEDWFHILDVPSAPGLPEWASLPSHLEKGFMKLLDIFSGRGVKVTCFFLAWVAERHRHLVVEAAVRGHEIASHGYAHRLVYQMSPDEFLEDATKSKRILEDILGRPVLGYRSAGFSVTEGTPWFFEKLAQAGYRYDSSVFPAPRQHGGMAAPWLGPYVVGRGSQSLVELPVSVVTIFGRPVCFFGGGYLRLFPYALVSTMGRRVLSEGRPVIFYIHPREVDTDHPRLKMSRVRRFKSYVNLNSVESKLEAILEEFPLVTCEQFIGENADLLEVE